VGISAGNDKRKEFAYIQSTEAGNDDSLSGGIRAVRTDDGGTVG